MKIEDIVHADLQTYLDKYGDKIKYILQCGSRKYRLIIAEEKK